MTTGLFASVLKHGLLCIPGWSQTLDSLPPALRWQAPAVMPRASLLAQIPGSRGKESWDEGQGSAHDRQCGRRLMPSSRLSTKSWRVSQIHREALSSLLGLPCKHTDFSEPLSVLSSEKRNDSVLLRGQMHRLNSRLPCSLGTALGSRQVTTLLHESNFQCPTKHLSRIMA